MKIRGLISLLEKLNKEKLESIQSAAKTFEKYLLSYSNECGIGFVGKTAELIKLDKF